LPLGLGSVRWRKVGRDLREHRIRSFLVVLSIAVGVMAVGTIAGANALLERNLADGYAATKPSSASLFTATPFDQDLVEVVGRMPGVAEAEGRRSVTVRMETAPGESIELQLTALEDFTSRPSPARGRRSAARSCSNARARSSNRRLPRATWSRSSSARTGPTPW
jgi:hypothetical protein